MDAHFDEQRRNQAEAGVHFFWLLILWASKEKSLAVKAKSNLTNNHNRVGKMPTREKGNHPVKE